MVTYEDFATGKVYRFLTNLLGYEALTIAELYRERWNVELFFKWMKQHLHIKSFYGTSENAVYTQIWIAVCSFLILALAKKKFGLEQSLYTISQTLGFVLFEKIPINQLFNKNQYMEANSETVNSIFSFRTKMKYELTVMDKEDRKKVVPLSFKPLPICGFYTELTHRYSCYDCRYAFAHRNSDITLGDMWGAEHIPELSIQFKDGLNVVVAHSTKGVDLLKSSDVEFRETDWKFLLHNPRMVYGHSELKNSRNRQILAYAFANYTYPELQEMYANYATIRKPVLMLKKVFRFIQAKQRRKKAVKYVLSLINKS